MRSHYSCEQELQRCLVSANFPWGSSTVFLARNSYSLCSHSGQRRSGRSNGVIQQAPQTLERTAC